MSSKVAPVLMRAADIVLLQHAMHTSGKSESTIRRLCKRHGIARQTCRSAPLEISAPGLEMALYGDLQALEKLRAGDRSSPEVRRYFDHLGIAV